MSIYDLTKMKNDLKSGTYTNLNEYEVGVLDAKRQAATERFDSRVSLSNQQDILGLSAGKSSAQRGETGKESRIQSNSVFARYNIDPASFDLDDLNKWMGEHNYEIKTTGSGESYYTPKYEGGFLGIGAKKKSSEQEDEDFRILKATAQNNARKSVTSKDNGALVSAVMGAADGVLFGAVPAAANWRAKREYEAAGLNPNDFVGWNDLKKKTVNAHKAANLAGSIAPSVMSLSGVSKAVSGATKGIKWFAKSPKWVRSAINSGIAFAISGGAETAFDGGSFTDVLKSAGINLIGGSTGGTLSGTVASVGEKLLFNKSLQKSVISKMLGGSGRSLLQHRVAPEVILGGLSSAAFAGGKAASTYFLYPEGYRPTAGEMANDLAVAFAFGAVSRGIGIAKTSAENKRYLDGLYQKMAADYERMAKANISGKDDVDGIRKFAKNVVGYSNVIEAYLTGKELNTVIDGKTYTFAPDKVRLVGQAKHVDSMLTELETIRRSANAALSGVGAPSTDLAAASGVSASNVPAPVGVPVSSSNARGQAAVSGSAPAAAHAAALVSAGLSSAAPGAEPAVRYAPEGANEEIKKIEDILTAKGADDATRKEVVSAALSIDKALGGTDRSVRSVFNKAAQITIGADAEIGRTSGAAYWRLFAENVKALAPDGVKENHGLVTEYANAYASALKNNDPEKYHSIMVAKDGTDLSAELPRTILQNVIPEKVQNAGEYRLAASAVKRIISNVEAQAAEERNKLYGANTDAAVSAEAAPAGSSESSAPKTITLTRVGDFYEAYGDEATELADKLNLTVTPRTINGKRVQMVGFPAHVLERYKNALGGMYDVKIANGSAAASGDTAPGSAQKSPVDGKEKNITRAKKRDWASHDVLWYAPDSKTVIAYSTRAASDLIEVMAGDNPTMSISELRGAINYDAEAKKVLQAYIDGGFGDITASEQFGSNKNAAVDATASADKASDMTGKSGLKKIDNSGTMKENEAGNSGNRGGNDLGEKETVYVRAANSGRSDFDGGRKAGTGEEYAEISGKITGTERGEELQRYNGDNGSTLEFRQIEQGSYTQEMRSVAESNKSVGFDTVFTQGEIKIYNKNGQLLYAAEDGCYNKVNKTIYINAHTKEKIENVSVHERVHGISRSNPSLFEELKFNLAKHIDAALFEEEIGLYAQPYEKAYHRQADMNGIVEEILANLSYEIYSDDIPGYAMNVGDIKKAYESFWESMAREAKKANVSSSEAKDTEVEILREELTRSGTELPPSAGKTGAEAKGNGYGEQSSHIQMGDAHNQEVGGVRKGSGNSDGLSASEPTSRRAGDNGQNISDGMGLRDGDRAVAHAQGVVERGKVNEQSSETSSPENIPGVKSSRNLAGNENANTEFDERISVDVNDLPVKFSNINEARSAFVSYARENFPKSVVNINTQAEIGISRTGIDKFLSGNISIQKYATGFKIPELIESAVKVGEAENKKGKDGITGYAYYNNSISINGKAFAVHIRVRKTDMGDKYYGHTISNDIDEIKIEPLARNSDGKSVHSVHASDSVNNSISHNDNAVNNKDMQNGSIYAKKNGETRSSRDIAGTDSISRWKTEQVEGNKSNNVNLAGIVKAIEEKFGISVATGKVTDRRASGIYKVRPETVRTRIANNLPTISHELGHHIDKKYNLSGLKSVEKLRKAVSNDFLERYPERERNGEAVAEFIRVYLKNTNEANKLCPEFYNEFIRALSSEDLTALNNIASAVNEYLSYDLSERYDAAIVSSQKKEKLSFREKWQKLYTNWVDAFHPQKEAMDYVEAVTGEKATGQNNAYVLATNSMNAHTRAHHVICEEFCDLNGNVVPGAKSFVDSIGMVDSKDVKLLDKYLVLKHSLEWIAPEQDDVQAKRVFADDTLENVEEIKKQIASIESEHPEIKTAADNLYEYQNNILKHFVIPAGGMTLDTMNTLNRKYPNYVPFYRAIGKKSGFAKGTFANQRTPIMRAKGSGAEIISPVESIIRNTEKMVKFAMRNQVMQAWAYYADNIDGFGQFMERVPPDLIPHFTDITGKKERFADALQQIVSSGDDYFAVSDLLDEVFGNSVSDFTPVANANKKIVTVLENGKPSYYQIHDDAFYESVAELSPKQTSGLLKVMNSIMQPMKLLITQNNPIFAMTNALRDIGTAYKLSPINNPVDFATRYVKALAGVIKNSEDYKKYKAMGGGHSSELTANIENISKTLRRVAEKDMGKARRLARAIFLHPVETVASLNDAVESVPRFMEFVRTLETDADLQEAIFNASDITTNFKRSGKGDTAKAVNKLVMFNNAAIQGLDKTFRTFATGNREDRYKTLLKWLLHAFLMSVIGFIYNKAVDDEGYENLSTYKKNNFYNFAIGDGKFISLPKPRENALLDSVTERALEYAFGNDEAFYDFGNYVGQQMLPPMLPDSLNPIDATHSVLGGTIFGGLIDVGFNKDFKDTPIESAYDSYIDSHERYTESTTKLAYGLGQTKLARDLDLSPKKIDHLISSYTGIFGQINKALLPMNSERRDVTLGLRNKFISDSNYSTDMLNILYDNKDKAEKQFNYSGTVDDAVTYEQNAIITSYISNMNKAVKALPAEEQRNGRSYLLKTLRSWNYDNTASQTEMLNRFAGESVSDGCVITSVPKSTLEWSETKKDKWGRTIKGSDGKAVKVKYSYQMTPQEYSEYVTDYLNLVEKYRLYQGKQTSSSADYTSVLEATKTEVNKVLSKKYQSKYSSKATKTEQ